MTYHTRGVSLFRRKKKEEPSDPVILNITNKTIRFGTSTWQISNLVHVATEEDTFEPVFKISVGKLVKAAIVLVSSISLTIYFAYWQWWVLAPILISILIIALGARERWKKKEWHEYSLQLETNSGSSCVFSSSSKAFIDKLVVRISDIMDNDAAPVSYTVNVQDNSITDNSEHVGGDKFQEIQGSQINNTKGQSRNNGETTMGDNFENIQHSTINNIKDSIVDGSFNSRGESEASVKTFLLEVLAEIDKAGGDVSATALLEGLKSELSKPTPEASKLQQYWDGLVKVCPGIGSIANCASKLAVLLGTA